MTLKEQMFRRAFKVASFAVPSIDTVLNETEPPDVVRRVQPLDRGRVVHKDNSLFDSFFNFNSNWKENEVTEQDAIEGCEQCSCHPGAKRFHQFFGILRVEPLHHDN